jgi:hypothetical protein
MSLFSYGENLTLIIEKVDDVSSTVSMESSLKVGFNIGGAHRHQKNFDKIIQELSKFLQNPQSDLTTGGTMSNTPSDKPKTKMGWGKKIGIGCGGCILIIIIIAAIASTSTENKGSSSILLAGQTTVANALAEDQIKKYNIVKENGSAMEAAAQAGIIAEMFLQAEDKENYKKWKAIEKKEQKRAGM